MDIYADSALCAFYVFLNLPQKLLKFCIYVRVLFLNVYTYLHILFLLTRKTFSTPEFFKFFQSRFVTGWRLRSGEMSNTLKERERIINSQGCVRKKRERQRKRERERECVTFPFRDFLIHAVSFVSLDGGRWLFLAINCYYGHHAWGLVRSSGQWWWWFLSARGREVRVVFAFSWIAKSL